VSKTDKPKPKILPLHISEIDDVDGWRRVARAESLPVTTWIKKLANDKVKKDKKQ